MKRIHLLVLLSALALLLAAASARGSGSGSLVVGEVYAAGGNSGAVYANDYVELFNRGASPVAVDGWTLQYASAAGTSWQSTALGGTIPAGGSYLVQLASGGANGTALPSADATGTSNLAVTGGKIALVDGATALSCGASAGSCSAASSIEDLVGYGSAADYEGSGAAPARKCDECHDACRLLYGHRRQRRGLRHGAAGPAELVCRSERLLGLAAAQRCERLGRGRRRHPAAALDRARPSDPELPRCSARDDSEPLPEHVTVTSNDPSGYSLTVHRTAFTPHDLPLGIGVGSGGLVAVPIAPAPDLSLAGASGPSADGGDTVATSVGFVSPLPVVTAGHYTATLTFTVVGK